MFKRPILLFILFILFSISQTTLAEEYFLYDLEETTIHHMGTNDVGFSQDIKMDKKPDLMLISGNPEEYIAVYLPEQDKKKKAPDIAGQLTVFNVTNGRTTDLVGLGYYPFHWSYTKDHKHFFLTYRVDPKEDAFELLHYDTVQKKTEKMAISAANVMDLKLSLDESQLYLLTQGNKLSPSSFSLVQYSPLATRKTFPAGAKPQEIYQLSNDRVALLDSDPNKTVAGSIQLIDLARNEVIDQQELKPCSTYCKWYEKARVLIIESEKAIFLGVHGFKGSGFYYKVSADGIKFQKYIPCLDFQYNQENDQFYLLTTNKLEVMNFDGSKPQKYNTGGNIFYPPLEGGFYLYQQLLLPDTDLQFIYCAKNGKIRIFDMKENKMLKELQCGRPGKNSSFLKLTGSLYANTTITTNADKSRYYILNRISKDITVLDKDFNIQSYLAFDEQPLEMYQINKPSVQTLVTTVKGIYQVDHESLTLVPIYEFEESTDQTHMIAEDNRLIFWTPNEVLVIDPINMEVKNSFKLFTKEDNMKVKKGERRYFFIRAL